MPTHRLLEGTDIAKLLAQVRDEHGEDAKIVRAERVRTGGIGGFFSREHFELAVEIDGHADSAAARDASTVAHAATMIESPAESVADLFGATLNSEFKKSVASSATSSAAATSSSSTVPDTAAELTAPVDALVSSAISQEDTFTRSGAKPVRNFVPTKIEAATTPVNRVVADVTVEHGREQSASMITPDVAQHILTAAAAAVAAAEATSRSLDSAQEVTSAPVVTSSPKAKRISATTTLERETAQQIAAPVVLMPVVETQEPTRGRHSRGAQIVSSAQESPSSDRSSLHVPFMGLATTSANDSLAALSSGALDAARGITADRTPLGTWLSADDNSDIDHLPWPPRRPGEVLVLVGDAVAGLHAARDIARHTRLGSASVFIVAPDLLPELSEERRIANPSHARTRRVELAQSQSASIVVIDAPLTMAGDPLAAEWVREMVTALDATAVWAIVDATRRPKDVRRWMAAIGRVDAIVAHDVSATSEPGELLQMGVPVAYLDGVHATGAAWHSVLAHAQALDRNAHLQSLPNTAADAGRS